MKRQLSIALLALVPATAAANNPELIHAAWKPAVIFAGNGDTEIALKHWQQVRDIQALMAEKFQLDQSARQFSNDLWQSLEDFNLKKFHTLLPQQNGDWREFTMHGSRDGNQYRYSDINANQLPALMQTLGETRLTMRAKQVPTNHQPDSILARGTHYLIDNEWAIGWGSYNWQSFRDAVNASTRLLYPAPVASDDPVIATARAEIAAQNPGLDAGDIDILLPLHLGFPHLARHFSTYGAIRDVVTTNDPPALTTRAAGTQMKQVSLTLVIDRQRLEKQYPEIYDYLNRVDNLVSLTLEIFNADGNLLTARLDTTDLAFHLDTWVRDDALIPVKNGVPQLDRPFRMADRTHHLTALANATFDVFGVTTEIRNIQSEAHYTPQEDAMQLSLKLNRIPQVSVHGAAFGFIPTRLIDALLPTDLNEAILDFMEIATLGNEGNGIETEVRLKNTATPGVTHVEVSNRVEALDSRLVRMGMSIINNRLMPDEHQSREFSALVQASSRAFQQDLAQYEELSRRLIAHSN